MGQASDRHFIDSLGAKEASRLMGLGLLGEGLGVWVYVQGFGLRVQGTCLGNDTHAMTAVAPAGREGSIYLLINVCCWSNGSSV